jgi:hypothetical protein
MWKPWELVTRSHERALDNARVAATELARLRVERAEVEEYVARRAAARAPVAGQPA